MCECVCVSRCSGVDCSQVIITSTARQPASINEKGDEPVSRKNNWKISEKRVENDKSLRTSLLKSVAFFLVRLPRPANFTLTLMCAVHDYTSSCLVFLSTS